MLVSLLLKSLFRVGKLTVIDATGKPHPFKGSDGPALTVRLHDRSLHQRLFINPPLALGESYSDDTLTTEDGTLYDFLELIGLNMKLTGQSQLQGSTGWLLRALRRFQQFNPKRLSRFNVAHHYDLSSAFYDLFLDSERQYSCAYFALPGASLEQAQEWKKRHIAAKLLVRPGHRVLDIGCGWGGLAVFLARETGCEVTGLTLSAEQLNFAEKSARKAGLSDRVRFYLRDYRDETGCFDRIVSVGMFKHVGIDYFKGFFRQVYDLLSEDGIALLHTIGRIDGCGFTDPWIRKYIFPGGYLPALSEILPAIEKTRLWTTDIEVLRLHYAKTIKCWRQRFLANRTKAEVLYDERFCRLWEYYLTISEITFRYLATTVFQIQLAKSQDAVPLTRDYIGELESGFAKSEPCADTRLLRRRRLRQSEIFRLIHRKESLSPFSPTQKTVP